jgi:hypothetical protein
MRDGRARYVLVAAAAVLVLVAVLAFRGDGLDNRSPEAVAALYVKAMVTGDSALMDKINRSGPLEFPTDMLMQDAVDYNWAQYDLAKFAYRRLPDGNVVEIIFPDGRTERIRTVAENGRWYFAGRCW